MDAKLNNYVIVTKTGIVAELETDEAAANANAREYALTNHVSAWAETSETWQARLDAKAQREAIAPLEQRIHHNGEQAALRVRVQIAEQRGFDAGQLKRAVDELQRSGQYKWSRALKFTAQAIQQAEQGKVVTISPSTVEWVLSEAARVRSERATRNALKPQMVEA